MRVSDFDYELPEERIAQAPIEPRDAARLLIDRGAGRTPDHRLVSDLPDLLRDGDLLVVNRSRVLAARLELAKDTGGKVEVLLLEPSEPERGAWRALVRPSRRVKQGSVLRRGDLEVTAGVDHGDGVREVQLRHGGAPVDAERADDVLSGVGLVPLPPYITRPLEDARRYQTVFASAPGSVAAPTAGLHLTPELLDSLRATGIDVAEVELHVGLDTFRPMTSDDPDGHRMHSERFVVPDDVLVACQAAERVVAVGTTCVRALESAVRGIEDRTDIFIRPPWDWRVVDLMMT
ncbi:MAG: S-adenosylmethionine:tRNA ribosyltransferase-isomerase, partial [Actinomycetota bacterium]